MTAADRLPGPPGDAQGGVVATRRDADAVGADLRADGWDVAMMRGGRDKSTVLEAIGTAMGFPSYYGRNLDALWDCLNDVDRPTALVWQGWEALAIGAPDDWAGVMSVLSERSRAPGRFCLVLTPAPPEDAPT